MADTANKQTLGEMIRDARVRKDLSLRGLADRLDKTPSYLSDIENDRRVPSEEVLQAIAAELGLDLNDLMAHAHRIGDDAEPYLKQEVEAWKVFRKIAQAKLGPKELEKLSKKVDELAKKGPNR